MAKEYQGYFWLLCRDPESRKPFLIFGGNTEEEARSKGLEMLSGIDFEIRRLRTRNLATASALVRGARLERGEGLRKATERLGHEKSMSRYLNRRRRRRA